uniref:Reverse transcriptase domain-containing protein n=1 Tax=Tanacetum cinerariifolium TaxID=118510 RepID=A0A6L2MHH9_TANCI|nr:hypothetical protein [Tanacetum cinerariifolium]
MRIDLTMLEEMKETDTMLDAMVENLEEKLDEVLMGRARLNSDDYDEEVKMRIVEHGLPKKMCDPCNFVLLVKVNGTIKMNALADTRASVSVLPYLLMNLGLGDPKLYNSNLTMADNTQAKAIGEVKNVRIQIEYQAYLVDFLILDIQVDKELPLLLGCPFFRTCGVVIDMGRGTLCINDGVIRHTYFPKPRAKGYLDNFAQEEEDDWLNCFDVGRDEDEHGLGNEGYRTYKKIEGDGDWHAKLEVTTPSGLKFTRMFKTKKTNRKLFGKFISKDSQGSTQGSSLNPLIANFEKRNKHGTIGYHLQQVKNTNLKWRELPSAERHAYCERLYKLQGYLNNEEVAKCLKPIDCETWTAKMLANKLDEGTHSLIQTEQEAPQPGLYFGGDHYGAHGDIYHAGPIVPNSGYEIGGSSAGCRGDDFDLIVDSKDCVESDDDEMRD